MTKSGKTLWQKEKLHVLCNFFFCHFVFKKPSAAEASESVYMRERVNYGSNGYPPLRSGLWGLALRLTGWCQDKWTSSIGYLPRKCSDINEKLLKSGIKQPKMNTNKTFNPFPHTGNLRQTTLKTARQKYGKSLQMMI